MRASQVLLLRTQAQADAFRKKYGAEYARQADRLAQWFNGFPLYTWVSYDPPDGREEFLTGALCLLHQEDRINITFKQDMTAVERGALSLEEYDAWAKTRFKHGAR